VPARWQPRPGFSCSRPHGGHPLDRPRRTDSCQVDTSASIETPSAGVRVASRRAGHSPSARGSPCGPPRGGRSAPSPRHVLERRSHRRNPNGGDTTRRSNEEAPPGGAAAGPHPATAGAPLPLPRGARNNKRRPSPFGAARFRAGAAARLEEACRARGKTLESPSSGQRRRTRRPAAKPHAEGAAAGVRVRLSQ
jgi:hypothetical protein